MDPIDIGSQKLKAKVTIDIYGNKLMNTIETKPSFASPSNLAYMFVIVRGWTRIDFKGQWFKFKITCTIDF